MTGWRLGYLGSACGPRLVSQLNKPHQYLTVCEVSFLVRPAWGVYVQAYRHPQSPASWPTWSPESQADDATRCWKLCAGPAGDVHYPDPQVAPFIFPRHFADNRLSSSAAALRLLKEAGVATVPGSVFGPDYDRHLRISYGSCSLEDLREGMRRIVNLAVLKR